MVLFLKGTPIAPRCGFSARTVECLESETDDYVAIDVLADEAIREAVKQHGNWPTIPQLYIAGDLVGGCDIVAALAADGGLAKLLGKRPSPAQAPHVTATPAAIKALHTAILDTDANASLQLKIDRRFHPEFELTQATQGLLQVSLGGDLSIWVDRATARRADGLSIDYRDDQSGRGLVLVLPQAPPPVRSLQVRELAAWLEADAVTVVDCRPPQACADVPFPLAHRRFEAERAALDALDRDTAIACLCHHGVSSQAVAEHFRELGFRRVFNVEGGIDAWSRDIDTHVSRY